MIESMHGFRFDSCLAFWKSIHKIVPSIVFIETGILQCPSFFGMYFVLISVF